MVVELWLLSQPEDRCYAKIEKLQTQAIGELVKASHFMAETGQLEAETTDSNINQVQVHRLLIADF